jgi:hypothetical protein
MTSSDPSDRHPRGWGPAARYASGPKPVGYGLGLRLGAVVHAERRTESERSLGASCHALATVGAAKPARLLPVGDLVTTGQRGGARPTATPAELSIRAEPFDYPTRGVR